MHYNLAIHGGAGTILRSEITPEQENEYREALFHALSVGEEVLKKGGSALDAVETAVTALEDCPLFNAGRGSVFSHHGKHEMDASIMCGQTLRAGAVALVEEVKNPVQLARAVMEKLPYVLLAGEGAKEFAKTIGLPLEQASYFHSDVRYEQWQESLQANQVRLDHAPPRDFKFGTVGAVASDKHGNLAAATSTGGLTNKQFGRIGDSPLIGAGTYADNLTCAISCTGYGEFFIRGVVAHDVACLMEYAQLSLQEAVQKVIHQKQHQLGGEGGLIAIDRHGNIVLDFNTEGMYRGWLKEGQFPQVEIFR